MYNKYILICLNLFYKILILIITLIIYISVIIKNYFNKEDREKIISNHTYLDKNIYNREYHKLDNDIDLYSYINHKNFNWSIKNIILNIFQGCIYDMLLDENAYFSKYIWLGNHERGILHEECKLIIRKFLIKDLIQKKKFHKIKILDIGCGTCKSIVDLDKLLRFNNIKAEFYGCDISPDILREGIINLKETNLNPYLLLCDGENIPYFNNTFDIVINFGSINQFPNINLGIDEMIRVVRPNGLCLVRDEHYDGNILNSFEKQYFNFIKNEKIPNELPNKLIKNIKIKLLNKIHFLLSFNKKK